jgi:NADH-quinone oxidoreductase subunit C
MEKKKILEELKQRFQDKFKGTSVQFGDEVFVIDKDSLLDIVNFLKAEPYAYTMLLDLTCVDDLGQEPRFQMVYHLYSLSNKHRLRIKAQLSEKDLSIDSLTPIWKNANWLEREVFDLFGVFFKGHPNLSRIFMYDGFEGHPLRKDYPLRRRQPRIPLRE